MMREILVVGGGRGGGGRGTFRVRSIRRGKGRKLGRGRGGIGEIYKRERKGWRKQGREFRFTR